MPNNTARPRRRKPSAIAQRRLPLDAPAHPRDEYRLRDTYDAADDFDGSIRDCYRAVRGGVAAGGEGWRPR